MRGWVGGWLDGWKYCVRKEGTCDSFVDLHGETAVVSGSTRKRLHHPGCLLRCLCGMQVPLLLDATKRKELDNYKSTLNEVRLTLLGLHAC